MKKSIFLSPLLLLIACAPELDMQGHDPVAYYRDNPIKNEVETKHARYNVMFAPGTLHLSPEERQAMARALGPVSPSAVERVMVRMHPNQVLYVQRLESITGALRAMGMPKPVFETAQALKREQAELDIAYAAVASPRCPDWRTSPVTTYSNTAQAGWGCAVTTNIGLMVADPRDLERGSGRVSPDAERNSLVIQKYRSNDAEGDDAAVEPAVVTPPQ